MINRGASKLSQYIYNPKTKKLEKDKTKTNTIESLSKQASKHVSNLADIGAEINKQNEVPKPINQLTVITSEDNLIHNYFYDFGYEWDMNNCLSTATIKMPKIDDENVNYWSTYQGALTIYGGNNFKDDKVNGQGFTNEQDAANSLAQYDENSEIKPLFRGSVSRVKKHQSNIVVYVNSIGVRFKQEIPDEFRQKYINGQNVADAFQAMCEFLGVDYICPPKKVNETEADTGNSNNNEGDGTENDVTQQQETTQEIVDTAKNKAEQSNNQTNNDTEQTNTDLNNNQEIQATINGYDDISFDANGMLVHGSTVIETSPDMAETLIQMQENPLERYLDDEKGITEKVQSFLDGDMFEELHNNVMDYGAITVQPQSTTSSDISSSNVGDTNVSDLSNSNSSDSNDNSNDKNNKNKNSKSKTPTASTKTKNQHQKATVLSKSYINTLTPEQARRLRTSSYQSSTYTSDTMQKLLWRSMGMTLR